MDLTRLLDPEETLHFSVSATDAGRRIDHLLTDLCPWVSRTRIKDWILTGRVSVNSEIMFKPGERVRPGDLIVARIEKSPRDLGESIEDLLPLRIVHDSGDFIVIDKPPGLLTHPVGGTIKRTALSAVALSLGERCSKGGPWLPHRLDRETSGLLCVAFTREKQVTLAQAFARGQIHRVYTAHVRGCFRGGAVSALEVDGTYFVIDTRLRIRTGRPMSVVVDAAGQTAKTLVRVLKFNDHTTELEVRPITGRMHQIRVHLAHLGHPILGDPLYGDPEIAKTPMALKAIELSGAELGPAPIKL